MMFPSSPTDFFGQTESETLNGKDSPSQQAAFAADSVPSIMGYKGCSLLVLGLARKYPFVFCVFPMLQGVFW